MRHGLTIFAAGTSLFLGACGAKDSADTTANADSGLTADKIEFNDVTAIDAVTGEAANMAADVDYAPLGDNEAVAEANDSSATTATSKPVAEPKPAPAKQKAPSKPALKPAPAPTPVPDFTPPADPGNTNG